MVALRPRRLESLFGGPLDKLTYDQVASLVANGVSESYSRVYLRELGALHLRAFPCCDHLRESGVDFLTGVAQNIISDGVVVVATLLLTVPAALGANAWRRRKQFRFFGVTKQHTRQLVYLSSLRVIPGGSIGFDGLPRSFQGHAIPSYEIDAMRPVIEMWSNTRLDAASERLRLRLSKWWLLRRVTPEVTASPLDVHRLQSGGSIIAIGSQGYNACTNYVMDVLGAYLHIVDGVSIRCTARNNEWRISPGPSTIDYAIVERVNVPATNTSYFVTAGLTTVGTTGAVLYLSKQWRQLYRRFGIEEFAICLAFRSIGMDPEAFRKPDVMFETRKSRSR
jgi:hypothetical protein